MLFAIFASSIGNIKAQCVAPSMVWQNPVLVSGTAGEINAEYKFPSVTPGVNAFVTVIDIVGGAALTSIDDNLYGYNAAWQPVVQTPLVQGASSSYVSFKIEFKDSADNQNHIFPCSQLSFIDVDGDSKAVREFVAVKDPNTVIVSNVTILTITYPGSGLVQATSPYTNFAGIDTSAFVTNIYFRYLNTYKINEVRIGHYTDDAFKVQDRYSCGYFMPVGMPVTVILPVQYLSFDADVIDKKVLLKWITTQDVSNSHYEVERSFDMRNYNSIGLVLDGFAVNNTDKSYQFKDYSPELQGRSMVYYRLKQFDSKGKITYSEILAVRLQANSSVKMLVSPNPFMEHLNIRFNAAENSSTAVIRISNLAGQTLLSKQAIINKGYHNIQIDGLSRLAAGMYTAQLILNGTVIENQKLIKN